MASQQTLWEAFKTVLRGQALSEITGLKKEQRKDIEVLESEILQLEEELTKGPCPNKTHTLSLKRKLSGARN